MDTTTRYGDIHDGLHETVMVIEAPDATTNWIKPHDVTCEELCGADVQSSSLSAHESLFAGLWRLACSHVLLADGRVRCVGEGISKRTLKALITRSGNDSNIVEWVEPQRNIVMSKVLSLLAACVVLTLLSLVRLKRHRSVS
jgi:hypothetical protein